MKMLDKAILHHMDILDESKRIREKAKKDYESIGYSGSSNASLMIVARLITDADRLEGYAAPKYNILKNIERFFCSGKISFKKTYTSPRIK